MNRKICFLVDSLSRGGAEKLVANLSIPLAEEGVSIYIVSMNNVIDYKFKGTLFNFGEIKETHSSWVSLIKFKNFFVNHNFDLIIDHRVRDVFIKEMLLSRFVFRKQKVVYCVHSYKLSFYFSFLKMPWLAKLPHVKKRKYVVVSRGIQQLLKERLDLKSHVIYNFLPKDLNLRQSEVFGDNRGKYILAVGRLTGIKQFDKLIVCYSQSILPSKHIKLIILGDGEEHKSLKTLIMKLNLEEKISLLPFRNNPYPIIQEAKVVVLTSKFEGFPMVLVEALGLNTPVIAYDCKSGPSEIIDDGLNGILVENQNESKLVKALNKMVDQSFYNKLTPQKGLERFSEEKVVQDWMNILESEI
ncbi:glycosyltransferase [Tamlana sp. 2_MG-2023]|uniref:glycosyltransferase n=1 Tax=unclassified Tamlana TaxID=2614803 RepID=UPI0026E3811F|nr:MULTISPECIES: glycosyltransferase [unclassified Tamlana]MDO6760190.1 glycosyltransferase [Tamlana sp. 2_MG-2023]MDO6790112.1 glycosyltransferase [Tamlana sp. 1_MG-2023]